MIREDRELLAELARLNTDVVPLAMRVMDGSVTAEEQCAFAERLINLASRFKVRVTPPWREVVEGEVVANLCVDEHTVQHQER